MGAPQRRQRIFGVWLPGTPWHARLVEADAHVHEFDSPFELARFLSQATSNPARGPASGGLR